MRDVERDGFSWREAGPVDTESAGESFGRGLGVGGGTGVGGARLPVVLLHGLTGSRLSWEPQLAHLGEQRRVVAWDLPGYGASAPLAGPASFAALADAVARFCDVLGEARVHLVGLSYGGMIAQYAAVAHPDRFASLSLLATSPKFGLDGTQPDEWRAARLAPLDAGQEPIDFAPRVMRAIAGPHIGDEAYEGQVAAAARVPSSGLRVSLDVLVTHDSRPLLGRIVTPSQVVVGELDGETPVAYATVLADGIPGAELHVVPGAGHLLNVEAPDAVDALLVRHFEATEAQ